MHLEGYLIASAYMVLVFLVRLLILTVPLFLLAAFVGLVDGLVRRYIRSFGAGRESGFLYHRATASLMPLAVLPWVVYLTLPVSVHPLLVLLPSAVMLGAAGGDVQEIPGRHVGEQGRQLLAGLHAYAAPVVVATGVVSTKMCIKQMT